MPKDAFTLRFLCAELNTLLSGGKINRIVQPENERVEFTVYTGKSTEKLVLDVKPSDPRIGITKEEKDAPLTAPNFCMLLRKHLLGATIDNIAVVGYDRVVKIDCTAGGEFADGKKTLFVELMGRYSNIILTEDGKVLGGNRGINFFDNGVRPLIVGRPYLFPPTSDKFTPDDQRLIAYFKDFNGDDLASYTANGVLGIALSTAREIVYGYDKKFIEYDGESFYGFLKDFLFSEEKNPCVATENGKVKDVFAFPYESAPSDLKFFKELYAAEDYYYINAGKDKAFNGDKNGVLSVVNAAIKKSDKKLALVVNRIADAEKAEEYRVKGELILSNIYLLKRGDKTLKTVNYYDGENIEISLDENLTPSENAEQYYKKYNKSKRALLNLKPQAEKLAEEKEYLLSVKDEIELTENADDIKAVKTELIRYGLIKERKITGKKTVEPNKRLYYIDGFIVKAGKNNVLNDEITLSANKRDIWLHAKDIHSSHVVIETDGKTPEMKTIIKAAEICAYYSKGRESGKTEIVYTEKKNVKKPKGAKAGFFVYDNYSSVAVEPLKHDELIKKE